MWTAYVQHTEYSNVIDSISKEESNNVRTQLGLYIDNNGVKVDLRMQKYVKVLDTRYYCQNTIGIQIL